MTKTTPDYRYTLSRQFGMLHARRVLFVMLNPSTAGDRHDDPTIRRCVYFAKRLANASELHVVNLYAARSTDPKWLKTFDDPVGPLNDRTIRAEVSAADIVVAAWGALHTEAHRRRAVRVMGMMVEATPMGQAIYRLGPPTKHGHPRHPLYLKKSVGLEVHV